MSDDVTIHTALRINGSFTQLHVVQMFAFRFPGHFLVFCFSHKNRLQASILQSDTIGMNILVMEEILHHNV